MLSGLGGSEADAVIIGLDAPDDAAVFAWDQRDAVVSTLDFFTPIVDEPYVFGAIAAANALSDIYAMGAEPLFALNIVAFPVKELALSILGEILRGGRDKAGEAGVPVIGGHSIDDKEPKYGLVVIGRVSADAIYRKSAGRAGDRLVLTKAIGTGIISTAIKRGEASDEAIDSAVSSMLQLNKDATSVARRCDVGALTDVTGFGLLGHLHEVAQQSGLAASLESSWVPVLSGARQLAAAGCIPGGSQRNLKYAVSFTDFSGETNELDRLLLSDAQTSGGLLISVAGADLTTLLDGLSAAGYAAAEIGELTEGEAGRIEVK